MFTGQYFAQKKINGIWIPTTTVNPGEIYRYWDFASGTPTSPELTATAKLDLDIPITIAEDICPVCGNTLNAENTKLVWLPGHPQERICSNCFVQFVKMAKTHFHKQKIGV